MGVIVYLNLCLIFLFSLSLSILGKGSEAIAQGGLPAGSMCNSWHECSSKSCVGQRCAQVGPEDYIGTTDGACWSRWCTFLQGIDSLGRYVRRGGRSGQPSGASCQRDNDCFNGTCFNQTCRDADVVRRLHSEISGCEGGAYEPIQSIHCPNGKVYILTHDPSVPGRIHTGCEGGQVSHDAQSITCPNGRIYRISLGGSDVGRNTTREGVAGPQNRGQSTQAPRGTNH
jgi:hypothetical protein